MILKTQQITNKREDSMFLIPHLRVCLLTLEREEWGERDIDWLPPPACVVGSRTHTLGVHGVTFQPTEPLGQGLSKNQISF